jgi:tetratricopeptide (TPR) repeat protein
LLLALATVLSSCAYYNTYYLARKYYLQGTNGEPYVFEKPTSADAPTQNNNPTFQKAIDYSKKLIAQYPNDKLVDDAYLLWARSLLANGDARETVKMLEDFPTLYPKSPLVREATFYLGVAYRKAHKYNNALRSLDQFLAAEPHHELTPYAHLERARTLMALERPEEAAAAAGEVIEHFPKSRLVDQARLARSEARFAQHAYDLARADFHEMGARARTDDERFDLLLREADCLEAARQFDQELSLLKDAIAHERAPAIPDTSIHSPLTPMPIVQSSTGAVDDDYGRLLLRIGTVHLLAGRFDQALDSYRTVALSYPHSTLSAEAQYRVGYAYENYGDDFDKARAEYSKVKEQSPSSTYATDASDRLANLDRLTQFKSAGGDSVQKKAEAAFLLAELYLFQLDKPDRALEEYKKIADGFTGTAIAAKAINAQAWVLSRKLKRQGAADSLFWTVVHDYPATEGQLAARDYLELSGQQVPEGLIKMPEVHLAAVDSSLLAPTDSLAAPPITPNLPLAGIGSHAPDSLQRAIFWQGTGPPIGHPPGPRGPGLQPPTFPDPSIGPSASRPPARGDSLQAIAPARRDTLPPPAVRAVPADSARADTTRSKP